MSEQETLHKEQKKVQSDMDARFSDFINETSKSVSPANFAYELSKLVELLALFAAEGVIVAEQREHPEARNAFARQRQYLIEAAHLLLMAGNARAEVLGA